MLKNYLLGTLNLYCLLVLILVALGFGSWPEGQVRPLFSASLLNGSSSTQPSVNKNKYFLGQMAIANSSVNENVGYASGLESLNEIGLFKAAYRSEVLNEELGFLQYVNSDFSYAYHLGQNGFPFSLGAGIEFENWCGSRSCDENRNYRFNSLWMVDSQIQVSVREQFGFKNVRSLGVNLGVKQASFEIEYHRVETVNRWVYRQIWSFDSDSNIDMVLGSEFYSNPFLWALWGRLEWNALFLRPKIIGVRHWGNRYELEMGVFF
jgi:hypothetical protein